MSNLRVLATNFQQQSAQQATPGFAAITQASIISNGHQQFMVMPLADYQAQKSDLKNWQMITLLTGAAGLVAIVALVVSFLSPQSVQASAPVIVEKEVVVPTRCIAFCR